MNKILLVLLSLLFLNDVMAQNWKKVYELRGVWKFSIGDDLKWADRNYNDAQWENIFVPSSWEDEGYPGYNGYAWYRTDFKLNEKGDKKNLYLRLGFIDDVDEVFVNGIFIGRTGSFPPHYNTAYNNERFYRIPDSVFVDNGLNTIAVRIYDRELTGGIIRGYCGIYEKRYNIKMEISLEGFWKFRKGDNPNYKRTNYSDKNWNDIFVPDTWENQESEDYNGYAWYRKKIIIPENYIGKRLMLLLGKIDDLDETYFNGQKIGSTGTFYEDEAWLDFDEEWQTIRAYPIEKNNIYYNGENIIAVRVFDGFVNGGIYQGPVGIVTYENYIKWRTENKEKSKGFFDWLFNDE